MTLPSASRWPPAAIRKLSVRSCLIDGEAIVCDANGLAVFDLLRRWGGDDVVLCAFDLLELDGQDMRRVPIEERKATLAKGRCAGRSPPRDGRRHAWREKANFWPSIARRDAPLCCKRRGQRGDSTSPAVGRRFFVPHTAAVTLPAG
jgi:hypothetical protein